MSELAERLAYTEQPQYAHIESGPEAVDSTFNTFMGLAAIGNLGKVKPFLGGLYDRGLNLYNEYQPYLNDIWQGRDLIFSNLFNTGKQARKLGGKYLKEHLKDRPVDTDFGTINFRNKLINETNQENLWQVPFARFNLSRAKNNIKMPNTKPEKRTDSDVFDNIEVNFLGKKYDYQVRNNNNDRTKDLYNIKKYKFLEKDIEKLKNNPELYQKFIELNDKGL